MGLAVGVNDGVLLELFLLGELLVANLAGIPFV